MEKYVIFSLVYFISGAIWIIVIAITAFAASILLPLLLAISPGIIVLLVLICGGGICAITCQVRCKNDLI